MKNPPLSNFLPICTKEFKELVAKVIIEGKIRGKRVQNCARSIKEGLVIKKGVENYTNDVTKSFLRDPKYKNTYHASDIF